MKRILFLFLSFTLSILCMAQTTVSLVANKDAVLGYHDTYNADNTNYGTAAHNGAYCIPGSNGGVNKNRALIGFNLGSIPAGATIVSANLNLYAYGPVSSYAGHTGNNNSAYLERVTNSWNENTVTWNTAPSSTGVNSVTLPVSASPTQDYTNINVTALVQDMINNPSSSDGFYLHLVNEISTNILMFCSREHSDTTKRPTLQVTYQCPSVQSVSENLIKEDNLILFPNPATDAVTIKYSVTAITDVVVTIVDLQGRKLFSDELGRKSGGEHIYTLDLRANNFASGFYYVILEANGKLSTAKLLKK